VVEQLLAIVPEELRVRLTEAVRQLLEALRALIDWCVARLERRAAAEVEVRDIPIL
jgi:DNA-binding HxlR family transcriptional regulator